MKGWALAVSPASTKTRAARNRIFIALLFASAFSHGGIRRVLLSSQELGVASARELRGRSVGILGRQVCGRALSKNSTASEIGPRTQPGRRDRMRRRKPRAGLRVDPRQAAGRFPRPELTGPCPNWAKASGSRRTDSQLLAPFAPLVRRLEIPRVARVQRQIHPDTARAWAGLPPRAAFHPEPWDVSQVCQAQRQIVVRRNVGGIPRDQVAVFLHALRIVACHPVEHTASGVTFALGHSVKVTERFLDVLLRILLLAQVQ